MVTESNISFSGSWFRDPFPVPPIVGGQAASNRKGKQGTNSFVTIFARVLIGIRAFFYAKKLFNPLKDKAFLPLEIQKTEHIFSDVKRLMGFTPTNRMPHVRVQIYIARLRRI
ncbi:hypothetical protein [Parasphingorhabdus sp.]|uniref:hypothetical protein n=1 Tax=Parasphingorhabdus sp. TaxID=2709688 RepID=UPI0035948D26